MGERELELVEINGWMGMILMIVWMDPYLNCYYYSSNICCKEVKK